MNRLSSVCLTNFILIKGLTKRLKFFMTEYCDFSYNTMAETYECRARKLEYDFVEIDRRVRNDIPEFLSRTQIISNRFYGKNFLKWV
jgi:hypothetical protein